MFVPFAFAEMIKWSSKSFFPLCPLGIVLLLCWSAHSRLNKILIYLSSHVVSKQIDRNVMEKVQMRWASYPNNGWIWWVKPRFLGGFCKDFCGFDWPRIESLCRYIDHALGTLTTTDGFTSGTWTSLQFYTFYPSRSTTSCSFFPQAAAWQSNSAVPSSWLQPWHQDVACGEKKQIVKDERWSDVFWRLKTHIS